MSDVETVALGAASHPAGVPVEAWWRIADDTVVTHDRTGQPASLFRHNVWDVSAYDNVALERGLYFRRRVPAAAHQDIVAASTRQWKQVMYLLMHKAFDDMPAIPTMSNWMGELRAFISFASERQLNLYQALGDSGTVFDYIAVPGKTKQRLALRAILTHLHRLGPTDTGLRVPFRELHAPLAELAAQCNDDSQHAVIPTRIYQRFLASCEYELALVEAIAPELEKLLDLACTGKPISPSAAFFSAAEYFGCDLLAERDASSQYFAALERLKRRKGAKISKATVAIEAGRSKCAITKSLREFDALTAAIAAANGDVRGPQDNASICSQEVKSDIRDFRGLSSFTTEICALCQVLILAFTGMRAGEAESLPYDCLKTFRQDGVEHYTIEGVTTKLSGGRVKRASWITSHLSVRAVKLAKRISGAAHRAHGAGAWAQSSDGKFRLFCRLGLWSGDYVPDRASSGMKLSMENLRQRAFQAITQEDLAELKLIDPHRAWEAEPKFALGAVWPFTRHQLRRTLALYAHRSGLVTLPSLKRQLHHITLEMSMYYCRGSAFAKSLIESDKSHFAREWAEAQGEAEHLAYVAQVLFADERLFGGHGVWATSRATKDSPVSVYSREETRAMFKKGQLAYKENPLGGCANPEPCDKSPFDWLDLGCLERDCKNLIVVPSKLLRTIKVQERRVEALRASALGSVEYRMEAAALATMLAAHEKIIKRSQS
ncbi:integrase [Caballeronia glebae]|uniref:integrase n=1 Tax=Caballeronia glebae TaxID=1777143 RepID=UPI0038BD82EA